MTDHKFTDDEVIKALECCANVYFLQSVLDIINRQAAKIKDLEKSLDSECDFCACSLLAQRDQARAEAIKEFAERLKAESILRSGFVPWYDIQETIDTLAKELTEEKK